MDAREAEAARRLAEGFAEEREWDLVEVVARRTIDGEGGLDAGLKQDGVAAFGRYLPTNAWAWKALGVVEIVSLLIPFSSHPDVCLTVEHIQQRRNYPPAIQAFQIALRANADDQSCWLRLGEAYSKAGRYAAAVKALERAHELQPDDWICSYFIGEVQRQIGQYQEAIDSFESILAHRPSEVGVLVSLGQTHLDLGRVELSSGFSARAEQSFVDCISTALRTIQETPGSRGVAWKTAADAIFSLANRSSFIDEKSVREALLAVVSVIKVDAADRLSDIMTLPSLDDDFPCTGLKALEIAVAAYDYRIFLGSNENAARGSASFDLGIALHVWATKATPGPKTEAANKKASVCLTDALREDPGNDSYWNALGNLNFLGKPKTAQHAYIKALDIDPKVRSKFDIYRGPVLTCISNRMLQHGQISAYYAFTTMIWNWLTKPYIEHKLSTLTIR